MGIQFNQLADGVQSIDGTGIIELSAGSILRIDTATISNNLDIVNKEYVDTLLGDNALISDINDLHQTLEIATTDNILTEMFLDGISDVINIQANSVVGFKIFISAAQTNGSSGLVKIIKGAIKNIAGATSLIGSITTESYGVDVAASTWLINVTADDATDYLKVEVQGENAKNINWKANVELSISNY